MKSVKTVIYSLSSFMLLLGASGMADAKSTKNHSQVYPKYHSIDLNNDGVITRSEWRSKSDQSFNNVDWNNDGILSGNELVSGATRPQADASINNSDAFQISDRNNDGFVTLGEWHSTDKSFQILDVNHDGRLKRSEFYKRSLYTTSAFNGLDLNNDRVITRREWRSDESIFNSLDANKNNMLTQAEYTGKQSSASVVEELFHSFFP